MVISTLVFGRTMNSHNLLEMVIKSLYADALMKDKVATSADCRCISQCIIIFLNSKGRIESNIHQITW